ncbi:probable serine/threonine-protein kinase PBL7 [Abrus precatorius]|uniref:Probable serine/threonine-protein kinase PBL7 n=1 Tax=Abrus precatorius TaxID=3816 RepID=A0A8B8JDW7_ABRPR|nr:probable serine/threonine-protein kinase PBL7 [Abrus precatorius]
MMDFCFSQGNCTDTNEASNAHVSSLVVNDFSDHKRLKFRTFLRKVIWDFTYAFVAVPCGGNNDLNGIKNTTLEHNNKAWLLAESGAELASADPQSVHSSFRFSFCSQVEVESFNMSSSSSAATVLMVNLEYESQAREMKWRRIKSLERNISPVVNTLIRFNYGEILSATRNFSEGRVLGRGALSCVFRGRVGLLRTAVAIKRLDKEDKECAKAFCRELMIASSLHNPNIVPLVGFCIDSEQGLFLVYKYVSGGNLEHHLHGRKKSVRGSSPLPWSVRYKVSIGIAEAVAYLHYGTERCVVHRDIKPSNILLSSKKIPKLCDFGLATWTSAPSVPFLCKTVKGTFGYLAPEYFQHGKVSDKTDVYALGVVLLELLTGRKPIEAKRPPGEENLVLWAKPLLKKGKGAIEELLDPQVKYKLRYSKQMARMVDAAAACVTSEESRRPSMHEILAILKGEIEPVLSKRRKSGYLGNGCLIDYYPQLQQTNNEMDSFLALAMLGVPEYEYEDGDYLYGH